MTPVSDAQWRVITSYGIEEFEHAEDASVAVAQWLREGVQYVFVQKVDE